jgi:hypothetical protein
MAATTPIEAVSGAAAAERDFSLVPGGPLFQLLLRAHMADDELRFVHRRIALAVLVMWAPIVALAAWQGALIGPGRSLMNDVGFQLRFLVAAPLLILAELVVHRRMRLIVGEFRARGLVRSGEAARFDDAVGDALRWRDSALAEVLLLVFVYVAGSLFTLHRYEAMRGAAWYLTGAAGRLSPAGRWLVFVSLPLIQFLLLRWYFRLFIWARFLWRVARLDLDLDVTHPDRAAGIGFLGDSLAAFVPIAFAHGVLFAGMIADRILFTGARLTDFKVQVFTSAVLLVVFFAGPLAVFAPRLERVKRVGLMAYGTLGERYVREFRAKWLSGAPPDEPLVGSGDIQSLADLGNSYGNAEQMRFAPVTPRLLIAFLLAFLAPFLPLLLTVMSLDRLLDQLAGLVF